MTNEQIDAWAQTRRDENNLNLMKDQAKLAKIGVFPDHYTEYGNGTPGMDRRNYRRTRKRIASKPKAEELSWLGKWGRHIKKTTNNITAPVTGVVDNIQRQRAISSLKKQQELDDNYGRRRGVEEIEGQKSYFVAVMLCLTALMALIFVITPKEENEIEDLIQKL